MTTAELGGNLHTIETAGRWDRLTEKRRWPTLNSLAFSGIVAFSAFGLETLEHGLRDGADLGFRVFCIASPFAFVVAHVGLPVLDRLLPVKEGEQFVAKPPKQRLRRDPDVNKRGARHTPPTHGERMGMARAAAQRLLSGQQSKRQQYKSDAPQVQAAVYHPGAELVEFYTVVTVMYQQHRDALTRSAFEQEFERGQSLYRRYIGRKNRDVRNRADIGIWKQWGIVEQVSGHGKCRFVHEIEDILRMSRRLMGYAKRQGWDL